MTVADWAVRRSSGSESRLATYGAVALAISAIVVGIRWNTFAAGGSDSHCYLQQARTLAAGSTVLREPLVFQVPWPAAELTFAPAGFVPSEHEAGASVPICPPGLALAMAPFMVFSPLGAVGDRLPFLVVPLFGGWAVWLTFLMSRRVGPSAIGLSAAALLVCSPIFVYQVVQPMSDVPAATLWLAAIAALSSWTPAGSALGGLAAGCALLIRPNLLPLAMVLGLFATAAAFRTGGRRPALTAATAFASGLVPGVVALLGFQWATYGSPWRTGYGDLGALFSINHVLPNARLYLGWLYESHGPVLGLALLAPFVVHDTRQRRTDAQEHPGPRWSVALLLSASVATLVCYLPYIEFDVWWYVRFLLPAIPLLIILTVAVLWRAVRWASPPMRYALIAAAVGVIGVRWQSGPEAGLARQLQRLERHFIDAGHLARRLPETAVVLTVADSGGVRFHGPRSTLLWESLDPAWFDRALDALRQLGRPPYLLLESGEVEAFKARFRHRTAVAELDWPPIFQVGTSLQVYDPADRERFRSGARVVTERLWTPVPAAPQGLAR